MTWNELLAERSAQRHAASRQEIEGLRKLIARDLEDAGISALSADRRFATAYNAALQSAKMAIACAGFRVASTPGHHRLTWHAARVALGAGAARSLDYFDSCRRKRNVIDYDAAAVVTRTEAAEILAEAKRFNDAVEVWIASKHRRFAR
ncbi:MAG: hypothetical protein ACREQ5_37550 [Candidatus Dormibacteria bacterium]